MRRSFKPAYSSQADLLRWKVTFGLGLGGMGTAVLSVALLWSYSPEAGFCGPGCIEQRLSELAGADRPLTAIEAGAARRLVASELAYSPVDISAWLREAALEVQASGRLDEAAKNDLMVSYRLAPVDGAQARWRLAFAFQHWSELTPQLKGAAIGEIQGLLVSPANINVLRDIEPTIINPAGRLACELIRQSVARTGAATLG